MSSLGGLLSGAPLPLEDPIAQAKRPQFGKGSDPQEGHITRSWLDWFTSLTNSVSAASTRIAAVELPAQVGDIGLTDISNGDLAHGVYRLSSYTSITTAGAAGLLQTIFNWTEAGLARAFTTTGLDTTDTTKSESATKLILVDGASPVRYSTTGATAGLAYTLVVTLESMQA